MTKRTAVRCSQQEKFVEAARKVEAHDSEEAFDEKLKRIATAKVKPTARGKKRQDHESDGKGGNSR